METAIAFYYSGLYTIDRLVVYDLLTTRRRVERTGIVEIETGVKNMTLIKVIRGIIWTVAIVLTCMIGGTALFGAWKALMTTNWNDFVDILGTIGKFIVLIILTFIAGGFILWAIREHVLPLSPEEQSKKLQQDKSGKNSHEESI